MEITANNFTYWLSHPLDCESLVVLRRIAKGYQSENAYLIAIECAEYNAGTLVITEKGREALEFFND